MSQSKRYPSSEALKNGRTVNTIESSCKKSDIIEEFLKLREAYKSVKRQYNKLKVLEEQKEGWDHDKKKLIIDSARKSDKIKELEIHIVALNGDMKLQKETSVDMGDKQRLEGFLKKKDQEIKELKEQIDSTKINNIEALKNKIRQQDLKIKHLSDGYSKFNLDEDDKIKEENTALKEQNEKYKIYTESLIKIIDEYQEKASLIYDISGPPVAPI